MLQLHNLDQLSKKRKRVGRGGDRGGSSGRGNNGQKARSGAGVRVSFEGGQMPFSRRLPKRGFTNIHQKEVKIVNLGDLELKFESGELVDRAALIKKGLIKGKGHFSVKLLGEGAITKSLQVRVDQCSAGALNAIKVAGGAVLLNEEIASGSVAS